MAGELKRTGWLYQETVVAIITDRFGHDFLYINELGNPAIKRNVLKAFRGLTKDVVWDRVELAWRFRNSGDLPGRLAD